MATVPSDYTIVGTVLAIAVAIILLSGLALYVAFRVRETLRDEKGRGARAAKVAFLIGLLFLSGGVFYFFASGFGAQNQATSQGTTSQSSSASSSATVLPTKSSVTSLATSSSTATLTTSTSVLTTTSTTTASAPGSPVTIQVTYPSTVSSGSGFYLQFTVYNSGSAPASGATLDLGSVIYTFTVVNATVCNPQCAPAPWSGSIVTVGTVNPGATVVNVGLRAPAQPTQFSGTTTLYYQGEPQPTSATITIRVTGRP